MLIAALTREHGGWEQACLRTSGERSRVQCLVPARGAPGQGAGRSQRRDSARRSRAEHEDNPQAAAVTDLRIETRDLPRGCLLYQLRIESFVSVGAACSRDGR